MANEEVSKVRLEANQSVIFERLAKWPPASETGFRAEGSITWEHAFIGKKPPTEPEQLLKRLRKFLVQYRAALVDDCAQYDLIRTEGLAQISDADIMFAEWPGLSVTDQAWKAIKQALELKSAHATYQRSMVQSLENKIAELEQLAPSPRRRKPRVPKAKDIPPGYEYVDVCLPAHQAFIVRKWAEAAKEKLTREGKHRG